jgi:hypothetical protein
MDERKNAEDAKGEPIVNAGGASEPITARADLPMVEAPSISPATPEAVADPASWPAASSDIVPTIDAVAISPEVAADAITPPTPTSASAPLFVLRPRHKRYVLLAASVAIAAVFGGVVGAVTGISSAPPRVDIAALEENKAMQQSVAKLAKEVTTLKASLDTANKAAHTQIAKLDQKLSDKLAERLNRESAEITGSISAPQTTPSAQTVAVPTPRPAPRISAVETQIPVRPAVVNGWSIRESRDGYVYVEGQAGIFQVVPGAPLPGLGPVESIKRQEGRWVVQTPKGIIVSMRDRRYFE